MNATTHSGAKPSCERPPESHKKFRGCSTLYGHESRADSVRSHLDPQSRVSLPLRTKIILHFTQDNINLSKTGW